MARVLGPSSTPRRRARCGIILLGLLVFAPATGVLAGAGGGPPRVDPASHVPDEVLIKFRPGARAGDRESVRAGLGSTRRRRFRSGAEQWRLGRGVTAEQAIARLRGHPLVEYIEPNYLVHALRTPDDPRFPELWGLRNTGQTGGMPGADIHAEAAWNIATGSRSVVVGIIDSGIDYYHPDLVKNLYVNPGEIAGNGLDDDFNGFVDDVRGWDFANDDNDPFDDAGHGTHVTGTVGAAGDNGLGVAGISWTVSLVPIKFLGQGGTGTSADAIAAIEYATLIGADITNNSWGGGGFSQAMLDAILESAAANILFVAAAGNLGTDTDMVPNFPSGYNAPNIVSVAATDHDDRLAVFSNYGRNTVDLAAPGVAVLSTVPGGGYGLKSGTSMAAPHVAGAAALILSIAPQADVGILKQALLDSVDPLPDLDGHTVSGGRLNAFLPIATPDNTPPAAVTDLVAGSPTSYSLTLSWTAPGDDGAAGTASAYDLRYATDPIDEASFDSANRVAATPDPHSGGSPEILEVKGLAFGTTYFLALKALDEWGNASPISNTATATTSGPPEIEVTPMSLQADLFTGGEAARVLTLHNTGVGELVYEALVEPSEASAAEPAPVSAAGSVRILLLQSHADVSEIRSLLSAFPDVAVVDEFDGEVLYPSPETLRRYDAVIVASDAVFADSIAVGDVLADYADDGGGVVLTLTAFHDQGLIRGRFLTEGYHPLRGAGGPIGGVLLDGFDPTHPIMAGVTAAAGSLADDAAMSPGSYLVAQWNTGQPFVATRGAHVAAINISVTGHGHWTGDIPRLLLNAALWTSSPGEWLSVDPPSGIVPPGGRRDLAVRFDAARLNGGDYSARIVIDSNDTDESPLIVPAGLRVTGAPDIAVPDPALAFGPVFLDGSRTLDLHVRNAGTDRLSIFAAPIDHPDFTAGPVPFMVEPGGMRPVAVTFRPSATGSVTATLVLESDDPDEATVSVVLSGTGIVPPDINVAPDTLDVDLRTGGTASVALTFSNTGGSDLHLETAVTFTAGGGTGGAGDTAAEPIARASGLEEILAELNAGYPSITSAIPNRFDFTEGDGGLSIREGGEDMYDDGNYLYTSRGGPLPYANNQVVSAAPFGTGGGYFTVKYPGLFVLGAEMQGVESFLVSGYLGANGAGSVDGAVLRVQVDGTDYVGFVKRVFGTGDPSVNHLVILPDGPGLSHAFSSNTDDDHHQVSGLSASRRMFYLLFAGGHGSYITDADALDIMTRFLNVVKLRPPWMAMSLESSTVPSGGSLDVQVRFDALHLGGGDYSAGIVVESNDPDEGHLFVPARLRVTGAADIVLPETTLRFGSLFVGDARSLDLIVGNEGTEPLSIDAIAADHPDFTADPPSFTLAPGESHAVTVTFRPATAGPIVATLALRNNDPDESVLGVALEGIGLVPPEIGIMPDALGADLFTGEVASRVLTISNSGGSDLTFDLGLLPPLPEAQASEIPAAGNDAGVGAGVLIVQNNGPWNSDVNQQLLAANSIPFEVIPSALLAETLLSTHEVLLVPSDQTTSFYAAFAARAEQVNAFVAGGGTLEFHAAGWGRSNGNASVVVLPGGMAINLYYAAANRVLAPDHPLMAGVPDPFRGTSASHCYFSGIPAGAREIATDDRGRTNFVVYRFGRGTVVAACQTLEFGYIFGQDAGIVLRNLIPFASGIAPDWAAFEPTRATVPAGASLDVQVRFGAAGLGGGDYLADILVASNDPDARQRFVPARLRVTSAPDVSLSPRALDFGSLFVGAARTLDLAVTNAGTEILEIGGLGTDHEDFAAGPPAFVLGPGEARQVQITFRPSAAGPAEATLTAQSNDPDEAVLVVQLNATGIPAPQIVVAPGFLQVDLHTGQETTRTLTISNPGGSNLTFDLGIHLRPDAPEAAGLIPMTGFRVLMVQDTAPWGTDSNQRVLTAHGIPFDVIPASQLEKTNLAPYSLILVPGDQPTSLYSTLITQAHRIDLFVSGGGVLEFHAAAWGHANGDAANVILPGGTRIRNHFANLNRVLAPGHPLMAGVPDPFSGNSLSHCYFSNVPEDALVVAEDEEGHAALTVYPHGKGTVVTGCQTLEYGYAFNLHAGLILRNMIPYSFNLLPAWIEADPVSGTVPPGGDFPVQVRFDATRLTGGDYLADLVLAGNDPDEERLDLSAILRVTGAPDITLSPEALGFGSLFAGDSRTLELTITNEGTEILAVGDIGADHPAFTADPPAFTLAPGGSRRVAVTFRPSAALPVSATLEVPSNDVDEPLVAVALSGTGLVAPDIAVTPGSVGADLFTGETTIRTFTLSNTGGVDLTYEAGPAFVAGAGADPAVGESGTGETGSLEEILAALDAGYQAITNVIPARFEFSGGESGQVIDDGGFDMYDHGNVLNTSRAGPISYSNGTILASPAFGATGRYFTRKYPGLFVLVADIRQVDSFRISGNLGADGLGAADGAVLEERISGVVYRGFVKRVFGAGDPSVNHLIIVADSPAATHEFAPGTDDDHHRVLNLAGSTRIVYLLYAARLGAYIDDPSTRTIMRRFLNTVRPRPSWLSIAPEAGTLPPGGRQDIQVRFDAARLQGGDHPADIIIDSNDPDETPLVVPTLLHVTGAPDIAFSGASLEFDPLFIGASRALDLTVSNVGADLLAVAGIGIDHADFSAEPANFTLAPQESRRVTVTFRPSAPGPVTAILTVPSNDVDEPAPGIPVRGTGLVAPHIEVLPDALEADLVTGAVTSRALTVSNTGGSDLVLEVSVAYAALPAVSGAGDAAGLETILARLDAGYQVVTDAIPGRFDFAEGASGVSIFDGGQDMFDQGNLLSTDLGGAVHYSNDAIVDGPLFGPGGRYFTRKFPGLFVLAADLRGINTFRIAGNLGANGAGSVDGAVLRARLNGIDYRGFVKRVYHAGDASVNHLVIVTDNPEAGHDFPADTDDDSHLISGLARSTRLFYLLYAARDGGYVDDAASLDLMGRFLGLLDLHASWLSVTPATGIVAAGGSLVVEVRFEAGRLGGGDYLADIVVGSNDPDGPRRPVPARLHVGVAPDITLSRQTLDFGAMFVGVSRTLSLTITNDGTDPLVVGALTLDRPDFTVEPASFSLEPLASRQVAVTFHPTAPGPAAATLTVWSDDADESSLVVALSGVGLVPPDIAVAPGILSEDLVIGESASRTLSIRNTGGADLAWAVRGGATPTLEEILASLNTGVSSVLEWIPGRFLFEGGASGASIPDGGQDMYDGGNILSTSLGGPVSYSDDAVVAGPLFGSTGRYFTRKYPGLFVLAADMLGNDSFLVSGNLGADGLGVTDGAVLDTHVAGVAYRGFVKRVFGATNPSVNHLVIVAANPHVTHQFPLQTDNDLHRVSNLGASDRIFYLLYAQGEGRHIDNDRTLRIMNAFLEVLHLPIRPIAASPTSGVVPPGGASEVSVSFDPVGLDPGAYQLPLEVRSNDPDEPGLVVPVTLTVLGDADHDGRPDVGDNCPDRANPDQRDSDADGPGDGCDNCPAAPNPDQDDANDDGSGDACQPVITLTEIRQDGGEALEVRARASDPQGDPLGGSLEFLGVRDAALPDLGYDFDCAHGFLPEGVPAEGIGFVFGSGGAPYLFDLDAFIGCGDSEPDYRIAAGTCARPQGGFDTFLDLATITPPASICLRKTLAESGGFETLVTGYDPGRLTLRLVGVSSLRIPFTAGLPRQVPIAGLEPGASYTLVITVTDGTTVPVLATGEFAHQGETRLIVNHPPEPDLDAPGAVECDRPGGALVALDGSASRDSDSTDGTRDDIVSYDWVLDPGSPAERSLGSGPRLEAAIPIGPQRIGLRLTDVMGEQVTGVIDVVVRDTTPPDLALMAVPATLWPPNHTLTPIRVLWQMHDRCDPAPSTALASAASSEPDDAAGSGDGATTADIAGLDPGTPDAEVWLRAERAGEGTGRTYRLTYRATDASGNASIGAAEIVVPRDGPLDPEPLVLTLAPADEPGGVRLHWNAVSGALAYDVIAGDLSKVRVEGSHLDLGAVRVLARSITATHVGEGPDPRVPAAGQAIFYLAQPRPDRGGAGFGTASAPWPAVPASCDGGCP